MRPVSAIEVRSFRDLKEFLGQNIAIQYQTVEDEIRRSSNSVKSYLVEVSEASAYDLSRWQEVLEGMRQTPEPALFLYETESEAIFVDRTDERFCLLHSISKTEAIDKILGQTLEESMSGFDRAWLPTHFLYNMHKVGNLRGFRFNHVRALDGARLDVSRDAPKERMLPRDTVRQTASVLTDAPALPPPITAAVTRPNLARTSSSLTFRDSETADSDYQEMERRGVFRGRHALEWVQYQTRIEDSYQNMNHTLYSSGKVTAYGSSIDLHMFLMNRLRERYSREIRNIEEQYSVSWGTSQAGRTLRGEPLYIRFPESLEVTELVGLARSIFRAGRPFRLFASMRSRSATRMDIEAVDLHTHGRFSVELTPAWMRLYLAEGTCGNVIARLLTNLQKTVGSDSFLTNGAGEPLLTGE